MFARYTESKRDVVALSEFLDGAGEGPPSSEIQGHLKALLDSFSETKETALLKCLADIVQKIEVNGKTVPGHLVNFKPALKNFDQDALQQIVDMPGRLPLITAVKQITQLVSTWRSLSSLVAGALDLTGLEKNRPGEHQDARAGQVDDCFEGRLRYHPEKRCEFDPWLLQGAEERQGNNSSYTAAGFEDASAGEDAGEHAEE